LDVVRVPEPVDDEDVFGLGVGQEVFEFVSLVVGVDR
jgi:hypothetical protein